MKPFDLDGYDEEDEYCRSILACMVEGVVIADPKGTILDMNPAALRLHEFENSNNVIKKLSEYPTVFDLYDLDGNVLPLEKWPLSRALNGETFSNIEVKVHRRDTGTIWIGNYNGTPVKDKECNFILAIVTIQDITSNITRRIQSEKELRANEERLRLALLVSNQGLYDFDIPAGSATVNDEYMTMLEYAPGEIQLTLPWWTNAIHPEDRKRARSILDDSISGKSPYYKMVFRMQTKSGGWRWILCQGKNIEYDNQGRPIRMLGTHIDITESKKTEDALRESEYFFKESQRAGNIGSYKFDFTTGYWISSEVLDQIFGIYSNYNKNIKGWLDIIHPDDRSQMQEYLDDEVIGKCLPFKKEYRIIRKSDNVLRWVDGLGNCSFDKQGKPLSMLGTIQDITERKQFEIALIGEKDRLSKIAAVLPGVIYSYYPLPDGSARLPYASPALFSVTGFRPEEIADDMSPFFTAIHPDDLKSVQESVSKAIHDQSPWHKEFRYNHPVKGEIWIEGSSVPAREANGALLWHGFFTDITERKRTEEALRGERNKLTRIAATVPGVICSFRQLPDGSAMMPYASPAYLTVMGFSPEEVAKDMSPVFRLVHPDDIEPLNRSIIESARTLSPWRAEFRYKHPQKGEVWIEGHSVPQREPDGSTNWHGFLTDITVRKRAEEALRLSEEKFSKAFMTSPDAIGIAGISDGVLVEVNNGCTEIFGYTREEMLGHSTLPEDLGIWLKKEDRDKIISILKNGGDVNSINLPFRRRDGSIRSGLYSSRIIQMKGKEYLLVITRDITEQKKSEEARNLLTRELRALSSCNEALIRAENEEVLLDEICHIICDIAGYRRAWVGFINNGQQPSIKVVATAGFIESFTKDVTYPLRDNDKSPIDDVIRNKRTVITTDLVNEPSGHHWSDYVLKYDCRSAISLPLLDGTNIIGVLCICSGESNIFAAEEVKLLEELSGDLSFGIVNLRTRVERGLAQKALVYEKELSDALIEASPGIFCVLDQNNRFLRMNTNSIKLKGLTRKNSVLHDPLDLIYKEDYKKAKQHLTQLPHVGYVQDDIRFEFKQGEISWWSMSGHAVTIAGATYLIISGFEITSRKQMETNLQTTLKEKDVLLQELYHRTKNNMQVISSYLAMQALTLDDENLQTIFSEMENRIRAMALVHEKLYKSKDLTNINLKNYLIDLTRLIFNSFTGASNKVTLTFELEEVSLTMDVAIPVGLVVTELLTNSLKYAFPESRTGNILLRLQKYDHSELELDINDNGVGVPDGFDFTHKSSIGIPTVLSIVQKQLRGSVKFDTSEGFKSKIIFRSDLYSRRV